jgi:hypothetical protein
VSHGCHEAAATGMTEERGGKATETGRIDEAGGVVRLGQFQWKWFLCLQLSKMVMWQLN